MPPKSIAPAVPRTHNVDPRCIQTSGIFRLPAELIVEILTYFGDPRRNVLSTKKGRGGCGSLDPEHVGRLTAIRRLTMTCWHLRNMLFPLLWKYTEGCNINYRRPIPQFPGSQDMFIYGNGLYPQCAYLVLNPTVGAYVQALSVDLCFRSSPKGLMTVFIDCLIRLPNLRTLEIFSTSHIGPITKGLKRKSARFPSIRELEVSNALAKFVGCCPNVESVSYADGLSWDGATLLCSYGKELKKLKRVLGVSEGCTWLVAKGYPDIQEISIKGGIGLTRRPVTDVKDAGHLRSLKRLAVVEVDFATHLSRPDGIDTAKRELCRAQVEADLKLWKIHMIQVLKESASKERKFLRWKVTGDRGRDVAPYIVEDGELEVLPETSP